MENLNHSHHCWLGCQFWLGKKNEQLLDDKEPYGKASILVQPTILVHTKKIGKNCHK